MPTLLLGLPGNHRPGGPQRADHRGKGGSELKITHSPKGFTERSGVLGTMALPREDLRDLNEVVLLNEREIDTVAGFNAPPSWKQERAADGRPLPPPGAGKFLLKIPGRVGIAVQMTLTATERTKHITDERSMMQTQLKGQVA